ncbi:MAG TPA: hypothetical protein VIL20_08475, partial [Sandaracinaceae bacterium]
ASAPPSRASGGDGGAPRSATSGMRLVTDEGGAVMTVGAFMAVFLVGVLYTLAGVGEAVAHQERLQETADAAAFSAAVTHARAMNVIGNTNATMAVIMSARAGFELAVEGGRLCETYNIIQYPADFCENLHALHAGYRDAAVPELDAALREGTQAALAVAETAPELAAQQVREIVAERIGNRARAAFLVPGPMAVRRGGTEPLCALANPYTGRMALIAMGVDIAYRIFGGSIDTGARIGRDLPHCPSVPGVHALVFDPPDRPVGTEPFQVRVVIVADDSRLRGLLAGARVPHRIFGRGTAHTRRWVDPSRERRGTLVVSQAEYYSPWEHAGLESDTPHHSVEEDAFRMDWRARLRRFRVPTGELLDDAQRDSRYRDFLNERVLPTCGGPCFDVMPELLAANDALH